MKKPVHIRDELERAAATLDELTVARLRAARLRAVAAADARPARLTWWMPVPAALAAAVAVVAVTVTLVWWRAPDSTMTAAADDVDWLLAGEAPDFFKEQLEFYHWLGDEQDAS